MANIYRRGEEVFLYVAFKDNKNQPMTIDFASVNVSCEYNGEVYPLLTAQSMNKMSDNEYYHNLIIPDDAPYAVYFVEYFGERIGTNITLKSTEEFHVIPNSENYDSAVKVYGLVHQEMTGYPLIGVNVEVEIADGSKIVSTSYTRDDGLWEVYLYPGEYNFIFSKFGFETQKITVQLGSNYTEIQFDNIALESEADAKKGTGVFKVFDRYTTKEGVPLNGLKVKASNVLYLGNVIDFPPSEDITNDDGEWELFLDPGVYIMKVTGTSLSENYEPIFRIKVTETGEFSFENITENVAFPENDISILPIGEERGNGSIIVSDIVTDGNGNPIIDVQINVYAENNPDLIIAQDYTSPGGKWQVHLNPGTYLFEFYHPKFYEFTEKREIP